MDGGHPANAARAVAGDVGLTHVATVSFLASRAAPSLQFFFALGGGIALARAAHGRGARTGYGTALASMLQTVAVMGPARINAPLTQAITAPMMGRLQARGARPADRVPRVPRRCGSCTTRCCSPRSSS